MMRLRRHLTPFLRSVVFIRQTALDARLDLQRVGLRTRGKFVERNPG